MSKVIIFSQNFPVYHPKSGNHTRFVEKIWEGLIRLDLITLSRTCELSRQSGIGGLDMNNIRNRIVDPKYHTVRFGHRWRSGDFFSPRVWSGVWSGKPYISPQIAICHDIQIEKTWDFTMDLDGVFCLDGKQIDVTSCGIPINDGFEHADDFLNWFPYGKHAFDGQIICWNPNLKY